MANTITIIRIICSISLLFCPTLSLPFYLFYIVAGITDVLDGAVARKTKTVSDFGSNLDSIADFVFVAVCLIKLLPILDIPTWLYIWIAVIALIKASNLVSCYVIRKKFIALHTVMNKVTGALLFALPLTLSVVDLKYSATIVCTVATFAAVQEGHLIRTKSNIC